MLETDETRIATAGESEYTDFRARETGSAQGNPLSRRTAILLLSALLAYAAVADIYKASRKVFWFDEICALSVAGRQTLPAIWDALHTSADSSPPVFDYLEGWAGRAASNPQIGYRLGSIAGVLCLCFCMFLFARTIVGETAGLMAAIFPLLTSIGSLYALEARPYGMLMGCLGLALLAWRKADRLPGAAALAILLALAVSLHYYAILAFVPFAAGEAVRWIRTGRFRVAPWAAIILGAFPLVAFWPLLAGYQAYYKGHLWSTA